MNDRPRILVAQIGARRHYAVPVILERAGLLGCLVTDASARDLLGSAAQFLTRCGLGGGVQRLADRSIPEIPPSKIKTFPLFALWRIWHRTHIKGTSSQRLHFAKQNAVFGKYVCSLNLRAYDAVYVFNGAAVEIAKAAKEKGIKVVLDQTSAPVRVEQRLLEEEQARWPGWEPQEKDDQGWEVLASREEEEWQLADLIVCGSDYVRDCLIAAGVSEEKIVVVPTAYGCQVTQCQTDAPGEFTALFAGTLCLRKGIQYFVEAAKRLEGQIRFRAIGASQLTHYGLSIVKRYVDYVGIVPRSRMSEEYSHASVLVLPTISEGSAAVCYEALACGVPVITTPNAGSVVRDSIEGFIVPIRRVDEIVASLSVLARDPKRHSQFALAASLRTDSFSWAKYGERLSLAIMRCFDN